MVATTTVQIGADRRRIPRWFLGRKTVSQFAGIGFLAALSFAASAILAHRTWDARDWVRHTGEVQLRIDRIAWHLLTLQQATQAQALNPERERVARLRDDVRDDLAEVARLTADNLPQQQRIAELGAAFAQYFARLESIFAQDAEQDIDRNLALATTIAVARLSKLVSEMRDQEDELLKQRITRANSLSFSAALIALLVALVARLINRVLRERETVLSEKDGELAAKDLMMREIDHRVRNSLNLIYNLMIFQQRKTTADSTARGLLADAANQILVVARVHERLYKYGAMEAVELGEYLHSLCTDVAAFSLPAESQAAIQLHSARAQVRAEQAIWLGLIVVELVTNAVKYGSPSLQSPIMVDVSPDEKELRIVVSDGGAGLPPGFDLKASKGLGMQVVLLLVRQLHATLEVDPAWSGSRFILTMPLCAAAANKTARALIETDQAA
jgi:two-component sensor histidine kinase